MASTPLAVADLLRIDAAAETERISQEIRKIVLTLFRRKGAVVAVSGGIDSSVVAALCVQALGRENVMLLFLPETDSSSDSLRLGGGEPFVAGVFLADGFLSSQFTGTEQPGQFGKRSAS